MIRHLEVARDSAIKARSQAMQALKAGIVSAPVDQREQLDGLGACPVLASSGKISRHRLSRGGNRQANAALYRIVVVRMRAHQPALDDVRRRTAEGKTKLDIIRCPKRFVAREIFSCLCRLPFAQPVTQSAF